MEKKDLAVMRLPEEKFLPARGAPVFGWAPARLLLALLLLVDALFIALYAAYGFDLIDDPKFGLIEDWSYGEIYQYIKEVWIVAMLAALAWCSRAWLLAGWSLFFVYLLTDDSCQVHERAGAWVADVFNLAEWPEIGLRAVDFGELAVSGTVALFFLILLLVLHFRSDARDRPLSRRLAILSALLIFFGVVMDMFHPETSWLVEKAIGAFEDGGEHVVMSVIVWQVFIAATTRDGTPLESDAPT